MMDIYEFNRLNVDERAEFTWNNATYIESIKEGSKGFSLYKSEKFFIEVEFSVKANNIVSIRAFKKGKRLDKFIDQVELEKLF
jgi:hypothetical protein